MSPLEIILFVIVVVALWSLFNLCMDRLFNRPTEVIPIEPDKTTEQDIFLHAKCPLYGEVIDTYFAFINEENGGLGLKLNKISQCPHCEQRLKWNNFDDIYVNYAVIKSLDNSNFSVIKPQGSVKE